MRCLQELALLTMPSGYQQVVQALEQVSSWIDRSLVRASAPPLITDQKMPLAKNCTRCLS